MAMDAIRGTVNTMSLWSVIVHIQQPAAYAGGSICLSEELLWRCWSGNKRAAAVQDLHSPFLKDRSGFCLWVSTTVSSYRLFVDSVIVKQTVVLIYWQLRSKNRLHLHVFGPGQEFQYSQYRKSLASDRQLTLLLLLLIIQLCQNTILYSCYFIYRLQHWPLYQNVSSRCYMTGHKVLSIPPNSPNLIVAVMSLFNPLLDKAGHQCQGFLMSSNKNEHILSKPLPSCGLIASQCFIWEH